MLKYNLGEAVEKVTGNFLYHIILCEDDENPEAGKTALPVHIFNIETAEMLIAGLELFELNMFKD